jgi:hypothetical protein
MGCSTPYYIATYNLNVLIKLLNPGLKKLHVESLVAPNIVIFLKRRPFVKWNNAKFTHTSCFTSLMYSVLFTQSGMILLNPPPATVLSSLCLLKSPDSLPGEYWIGPLGVGCFPGRCKSSELDSFRFWNSDNWALAPFCRKFLYVISCLRLVFCMQKCFEEHTI